MTSSGLASARADQVWRLLADLVQPLTTQRIPLGSADGRVLAAAVASRTDYPPFDRAVMDGFAVRCQDFSTARVELELAGLARAGDARNGPLPPGACVQINTGAAVPEGADAVVIVERTQAAGAGRVAMEDQPLPGQSIERRGAIRRAGEVVAAAPQRLTPGSLAAIAACGETSVEVFRSPRVAIVCTGDELAAPGTEPGAGQIFESNSAALSALVRERGAEPRCEPAAPDEAAVLRERLSDGLAFDVLCVSGGMSMGSHDLVPATFAELGVHWIVNSLNLKPGKPMRIGRAATGCWVLGLPGNPVSCAVCFLLFGRMILDGLQGLPMRPPPFLAGRLAGSVPANGARPMFHPGRAVATAAGELRVTPIDWRGSGDPFGLAGANCLIRRPARAPECPAGEQVFITPIASLS